MPDWVQIVAPDGGLKDIQLPKELPANTIVIYHDEDAIGLHFLRKDSGGRMVVRITLDGTIGVYSAHGTEYLSHPAKPPRASDA